MLDYVEERYLEALLRKMDVKKIKDEETYVKSLKAEEEVKKAQLEAEDKVRAAEVERVRQMKEKEKIKFLNSNYEKYEANFQLLTGKRNVYHLFVSALLVDMECLLDELQYLNSQFVQRGEKIKHEKMDFDSLDEDVKMSVVKFNKEKQKKLKITLNLPKMTMRKSFLNQDLANLLLISF